jgi:hypothetical protein
MSALLSWQAAEAIAAEARRLEREPPRRRRERARRRKRGR